MATVSRCGGKDVVALLSGEAEKNLSGSKTRSRVSHNPLSFTPSFSWVSRRRHDLQNRFQPFLFGSDGEPLKRLREPVKTWITYLKIGENERRSIPMCSADST